MQMHPDFDDIRDSDDFHEWAEEQPKWVQDSLYENDNDARSAARAIRVQQRQFRQRIKEASRKVMKRLHTLKSQM